MKKHFNRIAQTGAALFLAASLHPSTAHAEITEKNANSDFKHAVKQVRKAGQLATEHGLEDMKAEVARTGLKNIFKGNVVTLVVKSPDGQPIEGQPPITVVWNGNWRTLKFEEGLTGEDARGSMVKTKFKVGAEYTAIDRALDGNEPYNVQDVINTVAGEDNNSQLVTIAVRAGTTGATELVLLKGSGTMYGDEHLAPVLTDAAHLLDFAATVGNIDAEFPGAA